MQLHKLYGRLVQYSLNLRLFGIDEQRDRRDKRWYQGAQLRHAFGCDVARAFLIQHETERIRAQRHSLLHILFAGKTAEFHSGSHDFLKINLSLRPVQSHHTA